jgi:hypothetical protein
MNYFYFLFTCLFSNAAQPAVILEFLINETKNVMSNAITEYKKNE